MDIASIAEKALDFWRIDEKLRSAVESTIAASGVDRADDVAWVRRAATQPTPCAGSYIGPGERDFSVEEAFDALKIRCRQILKNKFYESEAWDMASIKAALRLR